MLLLYALGLGIGLAIGLNRDKDQNNSSSDIKVAIGAVVTDHEACSDVGRYSYMGRNARKITV